MSNENGHLSCTDVCSTGDPSSVYFVAKQLVDEKLPGEALAWAIVTIGQVVTIQSGLGIQGVQILGAGRISITLETDLIPLFVSNYAIVASTASPDFTATNIVVNRQAVSNLGFTLLFTNGSTRELTTPIGFSFVLFRN